MTFKAVSSNGDFLGVIVNEIMIRDNYNNKEQNDNFVEDKDPDNRFNKFMNIFKKVGRESDVFGKYTEINRIMVIKIVAVNDAFKGQGVCKVLFDKTKYALSIVYYKIIILLYRYIIVLV